MPAVSALRRAVRACVFICILTLFGLPAAPASANELRPRTLTLPIRVPTLKNWSAGAAIIAVTYSDTDATATVTAPSVLLGANGDFRIYTCLRAYSVKRSHSNSCPIKYVNTTGAAATGVFEAPSATATLARPPAGGKAWFTYQVTVQSRGADGNYKDVASSWPATNVAGTTVGVPALGETATAPPTSLGVALSTSSPGGVNTGQIDSFCATDELPAVAPAVDVDSGALGPDAPAYYEIGEPTGDHAGQPPKGIMLVIHGGAWMSVGPGAVADMRPEADRWRARGWRTLNIDYHACRAGLADVEWFLDHAREKWGTSLPYCALGTSAGGHLALELAISRPGLYCVIDRGGPTNALTLAGQKTTRSGTTGPRMAYNGMVAAFGPDELAWWSPARFGQALTSTRILFAAATNDFYIPWAQGTDLRDKILAADPNAYVDLDQLAAGTVPFVHAGVTQESLDAYYEHELQLVAPLG